MDSYESLMNEYADFMEKYNAGGHPASMAADYAKIMVKYNDAMKKLDAIDENSLTPEEQQYYIEVQDPRESATARRAPRRRNRRAPGVQRTVLNKKSASRR